MPLKKLVDFLDSNHIQYVNIKHSRAYTAQEVAASAHIPGKEMAKTVMIKVDGKLAFSVLPASYQVDFDLLKRSLGANQVELAAEEEFKAVFPECELGAMPPFGNLYDMEVFAAEKLSEDEEIAFNAGSHTELIRLKYDDFDRLVKPKVIRFSAT
jgi:Ala-tRNA(Pro) deacylase